MTQQERTELIREIKELLQLHYECKKTSVLSVFDEETIKVMKSVLQKLFQRNWPNN